MEYDNFNDWKAECDRNGYPTSQNTGFSENYGDIGDWDALTVGGVDHQSDIIGIWNAVDQYGWIGETVSYEDYVKMLEEEG